jgi:hypothetical protein
MCGVSYVWMMRQEVHTETKLGSVLSQMNPVTFHGLFEYTFRICGTVLCTETFKSVRFVHAISQQTVAVRCYIAAI